MPGSTFRYGSHFLESNSGDPPAFEQAANRRRCHAFAKGRYNTTGNKNILRPHPLSSERKKSARSELGLILQVDVGVQRILRRMHAAVNVAIKIAAMNFESKHKSLSSLQAGMYQSGFEAA